ncbi:MAG: hypothetical protein WCR71_05800, partial [Bacteroidales bacterium]
MGKPIADKPLGINAPKGHPEHTVPTQINSPGAYLSNLKEWHYHAMALKLKGFTMEQIAEVTGKSKNYLAQLFYTNNIFRDEWEALKEERINAAKDFLSNLAVDATRTLSGLLKSDSDMAQLGAAKTILDRVGISERHVFSGDIRSANINANLNDEAVQKVMEDPNVRKSA